MASRLKWREDDARMSQLNEAVFHAHNFFIGVTVVAMGLPCLLDPGVLLEKSRAALWGTWTLSFFWASRLWCQWFT